MSPVVMAVLLIEPIWNRNYILCVRRTKSTVLLIEPIWNRNDDDLFGLSTDDIAFNRTNLE